jgi:hypothetical protein
MLFLNWVRYAARSLGLGFGVMDGAPLMTDAESALKFDFAVDSRCAGATCNMYSALKAGE